MQGGKIVELKCNDFVLFRGLSNKYLLSKGKISNVVTNEKKNLTSKGNKNCMISLKVTEIKILFTLVIIFLIICECLYSECASFERSIGGQGM